MRFGRGMVLACAVIALSVLCPSTANASPVTGEMSTSAVRDSPVESSTSPINQSENLAPQPALQGLEGNTQSGRNDTSTSAGAGASAVSSVTVGTPSGAPADSETSQTSDSNTPSNQPESANQPHNSFDIEQNGSQTSDASINKSDTAGKQGDSASQVDEEPLTPAAQSGSCTPKTNQLWNGNGNNTMKWDLTADCHFVVKSAYVDANQSYDTLPWQPYRPQIVRFTIESWTNTTGLTNLYGMFANMNSMVSINGLEHINVSNVSGMWRMIYYNSLTSLDLSSWDFTRILNVGWSSEGNGHGYFMNNSLANLMRLGANQWMRGCYPTGSAGQFWGGDTPVRSNWISEDRTWNASQHTCGNRYDLGPTPTKQWYGVPGTVATVLYDLNGGNVADGATAPASVSATFPDGFKSTTVTMPKATGFSREGYRLLGWNRSPTAAAAQYTPGQQVPFDDLVETKLYAVWQKAPIPTLDTVTWPHTLTGGGTSVHAVGSIDTANGGPLATDDKFVAHWTWTGTDGTTHEADTDAIRDTSGNGWSANFTDLAAIADADGVGKGLQISAKAKVVASSGETSVWSNTKGANVDVVAPHVVDGAKARDGNVAGVVNSSDQPVGVVEDGDTVTVEWLDSMGAVITWTESSVPHQSSTASTADGGKFSINQPSGVTGARKVRITVSDSSGNTSEPITLSMEETLTSLPMTGSSKSPWSYLRLALACAAVLAITQYVRRKVAYRRDDDSLISC
ncbi:InlB B-repeat-containing protein [Bifidobacterium sp. ESL0732]|uniref:InlB B-repeat-containing protein n=1 Tax=Bifidobacterium sp. ESL0732 TaxID=2983222 RepID=UPI0023F7930C|nr:InlB B-repeat-containing protein [Bifidobacterium sp. ESL0732]WEV64460.1 InlB B-repeat-containing protein [Bifidobacterium sp. ESL0732]